MEQHNLVNIKTINPHIIVDLRYATENNVARRKVYKSDVCYLQKEVALKLDNVQKELEAQGLGLKIWDGYRPLSIQYKFWEFCPDERYVANPAKGSKHNRGSAVDLTLVDKHGNELPMPTEFDNFTERAHHSYMDLPHHIIANRQLLKNCMIKHGFSIVETEWWHYDDVNWQQYPLLDIVVE